MRHIYIPGLYMKDVLPFTCCGEQCWRDPLRGSSFSFAPVKKVPETGHWSHYLQLLTHLCSFVLQSVQANPSSLLLGAGAQSFPFFCDPAAENAVSAARSYPPLWEDFDICHEPPFAAGSARPWSASYSSAFLTQKYQ
jgi:hypothetical protein